MRFGFTTRSPRRPAPRRQPVARLLIEALETRDCPSAPSFTSFTATTLAGHQVRLSGVVSDPMPASVRITFSGAASGNTQADSSGSFSYATSSASLGTVNAVGVDWQNATSDTAGATIAVTSPAITFSISYGPQKTVTLSGQVNDIDQSGLTVSFTGAVTASVQTGSGGTFSLTTSAAALGTVTASVTDLWGLSASAQKVVSVAAPSIINFTATELTNNMWQFQGQVVDRDPGLTVTLGGLPELANQTLTADSTTGNFTIVIQLEPNETGTATAQTVDCWGQSSNLAQAALT